MMVMIISCHIVVAQVNKGQDRFKSHENYGPDGKVKIAKYC